MVIPTVHLGEPCWVDEDFYLCVFAGCYDNLSRVIEFWSHLSDRVKCEWARVTRILLILPYV